MIYNLKSLICFLQNLKILYDYKFSLIITIAFILIPGKSSARAPDIQFSHLTADDGLSYNTVTSIFQDRNGFLWIGTSYGLNRYDGYNFKIFLPETSNPNSISSRYITSICEDGNGSIWIGTPNGLNRYDWTTEKFYRYKNKKEDPHSLSSNLVLKIFADKSGTVWIGTLDGLNTYNSHNDNFDVIKKVSDRTNPDLQNSVTDIEEDLNDHLWLGTWNGLSCIQKDGKILKQFFAQPANFKKFNYRITSNIFKDNSNNLWIGTNGQGIKKYNLLTGKFENYLSIPGDQNTLSNGYITSIFQDRLNNIWIGTQYGLNKYNTKENNFTRILNDPQKSSSIFSNIITAITEDRNGLFWIGTFAGISRFFQSRNKFFYLQEDKNNPDKALISSNLISVFIDSNEKIWVGTTYGLDEIIKEKDKSRLTDCKVIHYLNNPGNKNSISNNFIRSIFVDHYGIVWIGTNNDGLNRFDPNTGKFKLYTYDNNNPSSISNNGITSICEDHNGTLWFGTWWGLNKFDRVNEKFLRYNSDPSNPNKLKNDHIWDLCVDKENNIWVGTDRGGLSKFNQQSNTFTNFSSDSTSKYYISDNKIFTILESSDGLIWIGTTNGLNCFNPKSGKTIVYSTKDGLPGNLINAIQEDNKGNLWIATDKGLSKFDRKGTVFLNYNKRSGLRVLSFMDNIASKSKDGTLFFGSAGLMYFHPDSLIDEYLTAPVVFTDLKIYNQSVPVSENGILKESITSSKIISIPSGKEVITFEFALLDFFDVKRNTFQYRLEGFDNNWNNIGNRNTATYTNLPPGEYTFDVKATNNNGLKNEKEASLKIIIIPAFYQTWWFRAAVVLGILLTVVVFFQMRTKAIKNRNKILENRVIERTKDLDKTIKELNSEIASKDKFFSIIAHDLRSPFTNLLGMSNLLVDKFDNITKSDLQIISENILNSAKRTYSLLENLLQWARIKTGRMNFEPRNITLKKIIDEMLKLYKGNAINKNISLTSEVNDELYAFADINMVETILRNLISNSIKFTNQGGKIIICVKDADDLLTITVKDTGVGISPENIGKLYQIDQNITTLGTQNEEGSGIGLILCKEFVEINKGELSVKSKVGEGSEFSFTLPKIEYKY